MLTRTGTCSDVTGSDLARLVPVFFCQVSGEFSRVFSNILHFGFVPSLLNKHEIVKTTVSGTPENK